MPVHDVHFGVYTTSVTRWLLFAQLSAGVRAAGAAGAPQEPGAAGDSARHLGEGGPRRGALQPVPGALLHTRMARRVVRTANNCT